MKRPRRVLPMFRLSRRDFDRGVQHLISRRRLEPLNRVQATAKMVASIRMVVKRPRKAG